MVSFISDILIITTAIIVMTSHKNEITVTQGILYLRYATSVLLSPRDCDTTSLLLCECDVSVV